MDGCEGKIQELMRYFSLKALLHKVKNRVYKHKSAMHKVFNAMRMVECFDCQSADLEFGRPPEID